MRLGELKHFLTFQAPAKDANGVVTYTTIFTCKGSWWGLSSAESFANQQESGNITGRVRIQYRPIAIKTNWRILIDNTIILNIVGPPINIGGDNKFYEIKVRQLE